MIQRLENLSVVIPAFNEANRIGPTVERVLRYLDSVLEKYELLVVNDGSSDATREVVLQASAGISQCRVIDNPENRGKGFSVRNGMLQATGEFVLMSDADLSTPIEELEKLAVHALEADVMIGSRGLKDSSLEQRQPFYRELMGRTFNLMVQTLALPGIWDSQCGFKLFRRTAAREVFQRTTIDGFGFDVEALYLAKQLGFSIAEVPIRWIDHPASKVSAVKDSLRMASDLVRIRMRHRGLSRTQWKS